MGSDDEWRYIRKGMGRGHEGSDRGRARVRGARIRGGSGCGIAEETGQRKDRRKFEVWKGVLCTEVGRHRMECGRMRARG